MSYHESLTPKRVAEIKASQDRWFTWANEERARAEKGFALHASADTGFAVVKAYDLELKTGQPHCSCCLKPTGGANSGMTFQRYSTR